MADPWSLRQLCDDGACTGVIGADGRCKVCGAAARNWGDERRRGLLDEDEAARKTADHVRARDPAPAGGKGGGKDGFAQRQLCPDGDCIGLLDARGVCKVCGKVARGAGAGAGAGAAAKDDEDAAAKDYDDEEYDEEAEGDDDEGEDADGDEGDADEGDDDEDADGDEGDDDESEDADGDGDDDEGDDDEDGDYDEDGDDHDRGDADGDDGDDAARQLCPDGGCTGLIGASGRCKVCGRAAERRP